MLRRILFIGCLCLSAIAVLAQVTAPQPSPGAGIWVETDTSTEHLDSFIAPFRLPSLDYAVQSMDLSTEQLQFLDSVITSNSDSVRGFVLLPKGDPVAVVDPEPVAMKVDTQLSCEDSLALAAEAANIPPFIIGQAEVVSEELLRTREVSQTPLWLFIVLAAQMLLLAILRVSFFREVGELVNAYFNLNISQQVYRDQELSTPISGVLLNLNFILSLSIFCWLTISILGWDFAWPDGVVFLLLLAFWLVAYVVKYVLFWLTALIFPFGEELDLYNFNFFLNQKLLGILFIPLNFLVAYSPQPWDRFGFYAAIVIAAVLILVRTAKGFVIGKNYLYTHQFHFVLYICTLEIVPLVVVLKVISDWLVTM